MSAKIYLWSDVHLDHIESKKEVTSTPTDRQKDILVLAGDLASADTKQKLTVPFLRKMSLYYKHVVFVLGNHDMHSEKATIDETRLWWRKKGSKMLPQNTHLLDNDVIFLEGYCFVGSTLWTDVTRDLTCIGSVLTSISDYAYIPRFSVSICNSMYIKNLTWLYTSLQKHKEEKNIVVVTHHLPFEECIADSYKDSKINTAFCAGKSLVQMVHSSSANIKVWLFGHTHTCVNKKAYGIRLFCYPKGYEVEKGGALSPTLLTDI